MSQLETPIKIADWTFDHAVVGNRITAFVGDQPVIDILDSSITTGNGAGLQASQTYSKFKNFRCRRA